MIVDQTEFTSALLNPELAVPKGLVDHSGRPAGKRFNVYRNNVVVSLIDAMQTAFPVIHKLVGDKFFKAMAKIYVQQHPPKNPMMMFYGKDFPAFLKTFEHVQKLPYLPDVARLELARRESYHAMDADPVSPDNLAALSPEDLMSAKFELAPSFILLSSPYPILSIWNMNMVEDAPKPQPVAETVMLVRPELDVVMAALDAPTNAFLSNLKELPLETAYDKALELDDTYDLSQGIGLLISHNIITKINT